MASQVAQAEGAWPCNLCGARESSVLARRDRRGRPLRTVICRCCGLCWSDPLPSPAELERYYREEYRLDYQGASTPRRVHVLRAGKNALARWRLLKPWLPPGARVLDAGAGGGELVYLLARLGCRATGIEPNRAYAEYAIREYGIDLRAGFWQKMDFPAGSFDLVTMYHVLEHTDDPRGALGRIREWLALGGTLAVEVPNVEAVCQSPRSRFHRAHLFHFNAATLEGAGRAAGFTPQHTLLSRDGGVLLVIFRRSEAPHAALTGLPGNFERITGRLARHTLLAHHLSHFPYWRPLERIGRSLAELWAVRGQPTGRQILDACFLRAGIPAGA